VAKILIWMSPEPGHLLPLVKVARDLIARGHDVTFQTVPSIRLELVRLGFETLSCFDELPHENLSILRPCHSASVIYKTLAQRIPSVADRAEFIRDELVRGVMATQADLLMVDGIMHHNFSLKLRPLIPARCAVLRIFTHLAHSPEFARDARSSGSEDPMVFLSPVEFELPRMRTKEFIYTEGAFYDVLSPFQVRSVPTVACCFGSQSEQYDRLTFHVNTLTEAARFLPEIRFVMDRKLVERVRKGAPSEWPVNVEGIAADEIPFFGRSVAAVITHGGFGTIKRCIAYARPIIVVPQAWDQDMNGRRVLYHNLGFKVDPEQATPRSIAKIIARAVGTDACSASLAAMRETFATADKEMRTAVLCEQLL
jgi:UDP:flavonoid glycosyltransferase YjiC (YdhE family)